MGDTPIPRAVIRRVRRVVDYIADRKEPEELMEDIRDLIRAFESLIEKWPHDGQGKAFEGTLSDVIRLGHISTMPHLREFIDKTNRFELASTDEVREWFAADGDVSFNKAAVIATWNRLRDAIRPPIRWHDHDSKDLARLIYRMRCAVVHPGLDTDNRLIESLLPRLREAMIEVVIARASQSFKMTYEAAKVDIFGA